MTWILLRLARQVPLAWGRACGVGLARVAFRLRGKERRLAEANLALALPEWDTDRRRDVLRASVRHLGRNFFHMLAATRLLQDSAAVVEESPAGAVVETIGSRLAQLSAAGRGVLVVTGHIGCWEWAGGWVAQVMAARGLGPLGVVTGTVHNPAVDRLLQNQRRSLGLHALPRDEGAAPLVRFLKGGGVVAVLLDQRTRARNLDVPFFGQPAPTPAAVARLALKFGIPVLPVAGVWDEVRQVLVMRHLPPLCPTDEPDLDECAFLTRCNAALETFIRRNPEQWIWFHRRWNPPHG